MRKLLATLIVLALGGAALFWTITHPRSVSAGEQAALNALSPDLENGALVFWAAGCASCHVAPNSEESDAPILAGGQGFPSDFGTFYAPNISTDPENGIGDWSLDDLATALKNGVSPDGKHYYPAFPYTAYLHMTDQDIVDLSGFLRTLPADPTPSKAHDVGFPFNIRRSVGGWKFLFQNDDYVLTTSLSSEEERGRYLVEGLSHCAECHTPRNALGGLDQSRWMAGAPNPDGPGRVPNITPAELTWSDGDLVAYLTQGFTPEFDTVGGHMAPVVDNLARLPAEDVTAIIAYLRKLAPVEAPVE